MFLNGLFGQAIEDAAAYSTAITLRLALEYGWSPTDIQALPFEWTLAALEYLSALSEIREVKSHK